jgi:hypothetical protein
MKSCIDPVTHQPLPSFDFQWEALVALARAWYIESKAKRILTCTKCKKFHLSDEQIISEVLHLVKCPHCKSKVGDNKVAYPRSGDAQQAKGDLTSTKGQGSRVYPCPYGYGWHVTTAAKLDSFRTLIEFERLAKLNKNKRPGDIKPTVDMEVTQNQQSMEQNIQALSDKFNLKRKN